MNLGIIDLGTNSARFGIYFIEPSGKVNCVFRQKIAIRLGSEVFSKGKIENTGLKRIISAFEEFKKHIREWKVDNIVAFATSALREATNRRSIIEQVYAKTGLQIKLLSGDQEANLIAKGIINNENMPSRFYVLVDIGGGSTEITICHYKTVLISKSIRLGSARLKEMFLKDIDKASIAGAEATSKLRVHVQKKLSQVFNKYNCPHTDIMIGSSGTIKAFNKVIKKTGVKYQPFEAKNLHTIVDKMSVLSENDLIFVEGVESRRVDIMLSGGLLLQEIIRFFDVKSIGVTSFSLRDGILESELEKLFKSRFK